MRPSRWPALLPVFLGVMFVFMMADFTACIPVESAADDESDTDDDRQIHGWWHEAAVPRSFTVRLRPGAGETWPTAGPVDIWLAKLDGTRVAAPDRLADERSDDRLVADFTFPEAVGNEALYLIRYRIGQGDAASNGSASLAEAMGSLQLRVLGPDTFQVGTQAAVRALITDRFTGRPVRDANVTVTLAGGGDQRPVFRGRTDVAGTARVAFAVPDVTWETSEMTVLAAWQGQRATVTRAVRIRHDAKILLTSDKPLYQPGQTMHLRALALAAGDTKPLADREGWFVVQDAKGNKVFKQRVRTDAFGIMSADFALADEVNMGVFQIQATLGETEAAKTVEVKRYALPKFKVAIEADQPWFTPGQTVHGTIDAQYIFGKPVAGGEVTIEGIATIVGPQKFADLQGRTDDHGRFTFSLQLPDTLTGTQVDQGKARLQIHALVVGPDGSRQEALRSFPVARTPLLVQVLPESGDLVAGVPNKVYVLVTTPDGEPRAAKLLAQPGRPPRADQWWRGDDVTAADELGLAEYTFDVPDDSGYSFTVRARDDAGHEVETVWRLRAERQAAALLLRPDRPTYRLGEMIELTAFVGKAPTKTVFFDLVRAGQTVLTTTAAIDAGRALARIPVTAEMTGGVVATAYVFDGNGNAVRDTRAIYVQPESDLQVDITPDADTYRPGADAAIDFRVTDRAGHPVAAALGVTIVDEAVFALQDMQPGLEKIFFTLEKELMTPRVEVHGFSPAAIVLDTDAVPQKRRAQTVMLSAIAPAMQPPIDAKIASDLQPSIREKLQKEIDDEFARLAARFEKVKGDRGEIDDALLRDPWFTPYRIAAGGPYLYRIDSAGPDRRFHTDDDLFTERGPRETRGRGRGFFDALREKAGDGMFFGAAGQAMRPEAAAVNEEVRDQAEVATGSDNDKKDTAGAAARVRKYFPETLYVNPALIADGSGHARLALPMADSITTWRIAAQTVSREGWLGSGTAPLRVFQDFFIDLDFPPVLTRNDEVQVPIALYNYLDRAQTVTLTIEPADWYELVSGDLTRHVRLGAGEVKAELLHLRATKVGKRALTVHARGSRLSDAVERAVLIEPDGQAVETNFTDRLENETRHVVNYPADAIPGANQLWVKIHPGLMSQVVEGLENIFRMPGGCFEQTSSTTYPNVMVLDYLRATKQVTPELAMKAEGFINQGYQRLLTFEVPGGGFEWFGNDPAHIILTAYGLMEFYDMSRVYNVDPDVITRTQNWLAARQQSDGSWKPNQQFYDTVASAFASDPVRNTAYVVWALARTGFQGPALAQGVAYLQKNQESAKDAYSLALVANALAAANDKSAALDAVFDRLGQLRHDDGDSTYWASETPTAIGSRGKGGDIETTALAAIAYLTAKRQPDVVNRVITYLIQNKDAYGTYYSTQATVWALQVLLASARGGGADVTGQVTVLVNGGVVGRVDLTPDNSDVVHLIDAGSALRDGENEVRLSFAGKGTPAYQVVARHFQPWVKADQPQPSDPIAIDVAYDKTRLAVDEIATCTVTVTNRAPGDFGMVVVDVGVPPGFAPQADTLKALVDAKVVSKYSTTARQITFYLDRLEQNRPVRLSYELKALFAMHAQTPQSEVYNYYEPETRAVAQPTMLRVDE